jgi:hypothetical protein
MSEPLKDSARRYFSHGGAETRRLLHRTEPKLRDSVAPCDTFITIVISSAQNPRLTTEATQPFDTTASKNSPPLHGLSLKETVKRVKALKVKGCSAPCGVSLHTPALGSQTSQRSSTAQEWARGWKHGNRCCRARSSDRSWTGSRTAGRGR